MNFVFLVRQIILTWLSELAGEVSRKSQEKINISWVLDFVKQKPGVNV